MMRNIVNIQVSLHTNKRILSLALLFFVLFVDSCTLMYDFLYLYVLAVLLRI